jgi:thymidylate synthase (FAD)
MHLVEPKVYLLGATTLRQDQVEAWLTDLGGERALQFLDGISDPEGLSMLAGRRCYKSFDVGLNPNVTKIREDNRAYIGNILQSGHGSVLEHSQANFALEWISRVCTHELVRHRAGCAISQESLRYVRLDEIGCWLPPEFQGNEEATTVFRQVVEACENAQRKLAEVFKIDGLNFTEKKKLTSAFRRCAPIGLATGMVWSANFRTLRWVLEQRTARHAEVEIRQVFGLVGDICMREWPLVFQDFKKIDTGDGLFEFVPENRKV